MAKARKKSGRSVSVDFTGVDSGGGGRLLPEDTYLFEIKEIEEKEGESSGQPYLAFTLEVADGEFVKTRAWDNFSLQPQALWKLRGLLETIGMDVPDGSMDIDLDELIGVMVKADVIHEPWEGKQKHRINSYMPADAESVEEVKEVKATPKKVVKKKPPEEEEEAGWQKGDKVTFMDEKKKILGKVISVNDKGVVTVRSGSDEYEIDGTDLEAA